MNDHYIPDPSNAHIDTKQFESEVSSTIDQVRSKNVKDDAIFEIAYDMIAVICDVSPKEPNDDDIICRFLDAAKFNWFCSGKEVHFSRPSQFEDRFECRIHEDYNNAVLRVFQDKNLRPWEWDYVTERKADDWNISCWTLLDSHEDDYLLWHKYARGPLGIGMTIRYGDLKQQIVNSIESAGNGLTKINCGFVDYSTSAGLAPYKKRNMFRNEKEIRFAFQEQSLAIRPPVSIENIGDKFRLRFSPDAPDHHRIAAESIWSACGFVLADNS